MNFQQSADAPMISICLPNLNNRRFLPERLDSIFRQSFTDWELVVVDNHSDDGAWEFFQEQAAREPRMRLSQAPREGMYPNWNNCVRQARGEFIYIATSDDTMAPDCLEKLHGALATQPQCGLAHCMLRTIDAEGNTVDTEWETKSMIGVASKEWLLRPHVRLAPYDGLLHLCGESLYTSITQLLIRRSLFDRIGFFKGDWGSQGDFHWNMRASLVVNTVHVPETWGGWRIHPSQATASIGYGKPEFRQRMDAMILDGVESVRGICAPRLMERLDSGWAGYFIEQRRLGEKLAALPNRYQRLATLAKLAIDSPYARARLYARLFSEKELSRPPEAVVLEWVQSLGIREPFVAGAPVPAHSAN